MRTPEFVARRHPEVQRAAGVRKGAARGGTAGPTMARRGRVTMRVLRTVCRARRGFSGSHSLCLSLCFPSVLPDSGGGVGVRPR